MKNKFLMILALGLFVPVLVNSSWYNPLSWFGGWTFNRAQNVEKNSKGIDGLLEKATSSNIQENEKTVIPVSKAVEPKPISKEVKKSPVIVDNSAAIKVQEKAKADMKAKEAQALLMVKQKAEIQAKIEAEQDRVEKENMAQKEKELLIVENEIKERKNLEQEYNSNVLEIKQQIVAIKSQYYKDVEALYKTAGSIDYKNGREQQILDEANKKINTLNLQIDQLELDYNSKLNQI